jgi:hypothetical protein
VRANVPDLIMDTDKKTVSRSAILPTNTRISNQLRSTFHILYCYERAKRTVHRMCMGCTAIERRRRGESVTVGSISLLRRS